MLIAGIVCLCLAALFGASVLRTVIRPSDSDITSQVQRALVPTQLAAAVMLVAGGVVALGAPTQIGLVALIAGVVGAIGTVGVGSWRGARFAADAADRPAGGCSGGCAGCDRLCR